MTAGLPGPQLTLSVGRPPEAFLRPIACKKDWQTLEDIASLTNWRNQFPNAFLTEFEATKARTAEWLDQSVADDDTRILFMVEDLQGRPFAYMGIAFIDWTRHYGEADAIVRGEKARKGLMTAALRTLLDWAQGQLGLSQIGVRVRSDNDAIEFYRKFGFQEEKREGLRQETNNGEKYWSESLDNENADIFLIHMRLKKK